METYFVEKSKFTLAGVSIRTTNAIEMSSDGRLSQLWETYFHSDIAVQTGTANPEHIYALYTDYESDATGAYTVVIGHESSKEINNLVRASVPESKYMVFKTNIGPVFEVVSQAWVEIWEYFKTSHEVRTFTGDFELYDARNSDPANTEVEIYIAIE
jgi:predicted transcriptional regulator YdeE